MAREFTRAGLPLVHVSDLTSVSMVSELRQVGASRVTTSEAVALALNDLGEGAAAEALFESLQNSSAAYQAMQRQLGGSQYVEAKQAKAAAHQAQIADVRRREEAAPKKSDLG